MSVPGRACTSVRTPRSVCSDQFSFQRSCYAAFRPTAPLLLCVARHSSRSRSYNRATTQPTIRATSEFWYEDEPEYDSLTDQIKPKNVMLVAAPSEESQGAVLQSLRAAVQQAVFHTAISGEQEYQFAQQLWVGRDGPPYFHKVRRRPALDAAAADPQAAESVWQELLSQNWRVELDYGLGVDIPEDETLLVVCSAQAAQQLLEAAGLGMNSSSGGVPEEQTIQPGSITVVHASGTATAEEPAASSWQSQPKQLRVYVSHVESRDDLQRLLCSAVK